MKNLFIGLAFLFSLLCVEAKAWELYLNRLGEGRPRVASAVMGLDPDDWTRTELLDLRSRGGFPIAWLNVGRIEEGRSFTSTLERKGFVANPKKEKMLNPPVRFYLASWRNLLRERIREVAQKGFLGLLLTGSDVHAIVSDNPVSFQEMEGLLKFLAAEFKRQIPTGQVFLYQGTEFWEGPLSGLMNGFVVDGLWAGETGKWRKPWDREPVLRKLQAFRQGGAKILTIDSPKTEARKTRILAEAVALGFEPEIHVLPIKISRRPLQ